MKFKGLVLLILVLVILLIAGMIGVKNDHLVLVNYLFAETQMSMSVLMTLSFMFGFIACFIVFLMIYLRLKWQVKSLVRKNKKLAQMTPEK